MSEARTAAEAVEQGGVSESEVETNDDSENDVFSGVVGHGGAKAFIGAALRKGETHVLLHGPPASGKSVMMTALEDNMPEGVVVYRDSKQITPSRLREVLREDPPILILDEIDALDNDAYDVLSIPMEHGRLLADSNEWIHTEEDAREIGRVVSEQVGEDDPRAARDIANLASSVEEAKQLASVRHNPDADVDVGPLKPSEVARARETGTVSNDELTEQMVQELVRASNGAGEAPQDAAEADSPEEQDVSGGGTDEAAARGEEDASDGVEDAVEGAVEDAVQP